MVPCASMLVCQHVYIGVCFIEGEGAEIERGGEKPRETRYIYIYIQRDRERERERERERGGGERGRLTCERDIKTTRVGKEADKATQ